MSGLDADSSSRRGLLVGLALGAPVMAYGVRGALVDASDTHPAELARWVVGLAVVNDALVVPAAMVVGLVARRWAPDRAWPAVRAGLLASAVLGAVAWPLVRGFGADPANPSLFPRDYGAGLAVALAAVWAAVLVAVLVARRRGRAGGVLRSGEQATGPGDPRPGRA
ncbi:MAG TPA: hypothetical protein VIM97_01275 [Actinomycetes bacterium]